MIRVVVGRAALASALVWLLVQAGPAQEKKASPDKKADAKPAEPKQVPNTANVSMQSLKINELIKKGYESAGIKRVAAPAKDHEFIRRVFIDLLGRIATPEELLDFERDRSADRKTKLVQRLLSSQEYTPKDKRGRPFTLPGSTSKKKIPITKYYAEEFAEHWANIWTVWLMTRTGHPDYRAQMHAWLKNEFSITDRRPNISHKDMVVKLLTATGQVGGAKPTSGFWTPKESYAANFIVHHLGEPIRDAKTRATDGAFDCVPITSRVTKIFLGIQTQCTQCHDHPLTKDWKMIDFWGMNAFFRQTVRSGTPSAAPMGNNQKNLNAASITLTDMNDINTEMLVYYERRDGRLISTPPVMLREYAQAQVGEDSKKRLTPAILGNKTRRQQLAEWVLAHDNFSRAYVNRIWAHLFGRGLNKEAAADNFNSDNEIVHPELLDYLAEEFAKYNYDPKKLLEWICSSEVYQLSHVGVKEYMDVKYDPYFTRMPMKAMSPEVLFESLMTATGTMAEKKNPLATETRRAARVAWMRKLVRQFGDDEGNELSFNGTIVQALLMMNGAELNGEIGVGRSASAANAIDEMLKGKGASPKTLYDELFMRTLNRHPTLAEVKKLDEVRTGYATIQLNQPPTPPKKGTRKPPRVTRGPRRPANSGSTRIPPSGDRTFYQDVFWALLNTSEFMINH